MLTKLLLLVLDDNIYHSKPMTLYVWRVKTRLPERYMTRCKVIARGKMNTCLVEFEDGYRVTTSRNYVMKLETMQKRLAKRSSEELNKGRE
jgi:hypothetical protein